ncbi:DUF4352 domain-containing protein [Streptomyces sp. NPDC047315]|uniref:DUF4352 domain-containing protein n=1 Tax=Streptomyces sp. NPDC047315 TaxID=3155142 RepID=UPI0033EE2969
MRRMASALLLSALALGATGCQGAPDDRRDAASARADGKGPDGKGPDGVRRAAWLGDAVDLGGGASGEHLRMTVHGYVDPAVAVRKAKQPRPQPAEGRRWLGVDVALLNVGGSRHDARRTAAWVTDDRGKRHSVLSGTAADVKEFTTGIPLKWNTLAVGEQSEGWLVFDVPEDARITRFHSTLGTTTVTWLLQHPPSR